jgi:hypothetical protein
MKKKYLVGAAVAGLMALGPVDALAEPVTPPVSLTGEEFTFDGETYGSANITCDESNDGSGSVEFEAAGFAFGPYNGRFTAVGTATSEGSVLTSFTEQFTLTPSAETVAATGVTLITGTKTLPEALENYILICQENPHSGVVQFYSQADPIYSATLHTATGSYTTSGNAFVEFFAVGTQSGLFQNFSTGTTPADPDADDDDIPDDDDNCPTTPNTDQVDLDEDDLGDVCDPDDDNDGFVDTGDNCPRLANPDQLDSDSDDLGDACDTDDDNDTVLDAADNCPTTPNTDQLDSDGDNIGNACDATPFPTPATADQCKENGWRTRTDHFGTPFTNQGDCQSYIATGGRNLADGP